MTINIISQYLQPNSILDIGANTGQFYHEIKQVFPNANYTLIEGNAHCEAVLQNLNTEYYIALLSDSVKLVNFYLRKNELNCTGNSIYREKTSYYDDNEILIVQQQTNTLENILRSRIFDLIKIDCQGSEIDIIKGGLDLIKQAKGVLLEVSLVEFNLGAPTKNSVFDFMETLNFYPTEIIDDIYHPIDHTLIQQNILFINQNI
jgi:FkbM family methyltransferase